MFASSAEEPTRVRSRATPLRGSGPGSSTSADRAPAGALNRDTIWVGAGPQAARSAGPQAAISASPQTHPHSGHPELTPYRAPGSTTGTAAAGATAPGTAAAGTASGTTGTGTGSGPCRVFWTSAKLSRSRSY